jgi:hypothetical protein
MDLGRSRVAESSARVLWAFELLRAPGLLVPAIYLGNPESYLRVLIPPVYFSSICRHLQSRRHGIYRSRAGLHGCGHYHCGGLRSLRPLAKPDFEAESADIHESTKHDAIEPTAYRDILPRFAARILAPKEDVHGTPRRAGCGPHLSFAGNRIQDACAVCRSSSDSNYRDA